MNLNISAAVLAWRLAGSLYTVWAATQECRRLSVSGCVSVSSLRCRTSTDLLQ